MGVKIGKSNGKASNGRATNGQFLPGWRGGPGRPPRAREESYLLALSEAVTPKVWAGIVQRAIADAQEGNHQARSWLAEYLIGGMNLAGAIEAEAKADENRERISEILAKLNVEIRRRKAAGEWVEDEQPEDEQPALPLLPVAR